MISVETFPLNSETLYIYRGVNICACGTVTR